MSFPAPNITHSAAHTYTITEINGTGGVAFLSNSLANSGSGTLRTVAVWAAAYLRYKKVTSQR